MSLLVGLSCVCAILLVYIYYRERERERERETASNPRPLYNLQLHYTLAHTSALSTMSRKAMIQKELAQLIYYLTTFGCEASLSREQ